jgi:magnesium chelatase accessory protein
VSPEQRALYAALTRSEPHVAALLAMLGHWDLAALARELPRVAAPVTLLAGTRDAWVPPRAQAAAARLLPNATVVPLDGLGHLAHEEAPALVAEHVERAAAAAGAPEPVGAAG